MTYDAGQCGMENHHEYRRRRWCANPCTTSDPQFRGRSNARLRIHSFYISGKFLPTKSLRDSDDVAQDSSLTRTLDFHPAYTRYSIDASILAAGEWIFDALL